MPQSKKNLSSPYQKRFDKMKLKAYDAIAAARMNSKDIERLKATLENVKTEIEGLEEDMEEQPIQEEQKKQLSIKNVVVHKKIAVKRKRRSTSFGNWLFSNNEL